MLLGRLIAYMCQIEVPGDVIDGQGKDPMKVDGYFSVLFDEVGLDALDESFTGSNCPHSSALVEKRQ